MRRSATLLAFGLVVLAALAPSASRPKAEDEPAWPEEIRRLLALPGRRSTSIGAPGDGSLRGGVAFPMQGPGFRWSTVRDPRARYGTVETVQALVRAALAVHRRLPGGEVTVNDLSLVHGGPIPHHGSHRAGRDVDVLFYLLDAEGHPRPGVGAPLDPAGEGVDFRDLATPDDDVPVRIDVERSWAYVEALILDPHAQLGRIFLVEHLRTLLLDHARAHGGDPHAIARFEELTCQPSYPHDDHFHFRFFCTPEDVRAGCTDAAPIYPWHAAAMRRAGASPVQARPRPDRPRSAITTEEEARASLPANRDPAVDAWLARRESWRRQPHPGRRYCR
ncbi:MAG: penicillin-insensitive murein endopeptidase [Polyangiales bacterium]